MHAFARQTAINQSFSSGTASLAAGAAACLAFLALRAFERFLP